MLVTEGLTETFLLIKPVKCCLGQNQRTGDKPASVSTALSSFHECFHYSVETPRKCFGFLL